MKCKICSCLVSSFEVQSKQYYHCSDCSFIFLDPKYIISSEREKERYLKHENTSSNEGYVAMFNEFLNKIPLKGKILDFGCGPSPVLKEILESKGFEVDIYDKYFYDKPIKGKYDLITCTEVVEHLKDPLTTLKFLKRHLNDKGVIAIMTLFHPSLSSFKDWWYITDETHISFFNKNTFEKIAKLLDINIEFLNDKNSILLKKR